ncbi:thioesterase family protein [Talaromyces proteolyticus]|uniref:Thioesterase family protein n=1 Tax=Talaromyces proteolyticus TaxID=1131652 RepID=A0AAD4KIX8_9EURO|nr:thioesterase family protein [Talaromyces proteolyticus]KAH8692257.1 thioesterase family protein [Talaromyces proteolyticus]
MTTILQKQIDLVQQDSHVYYVSFHRDWIIGPSIHGGILAAILQHTTKRHFMTTLSAQDQPDILSMHIDFLRMCTHDPMVITVTDLKTGQGTSTIQLHLTQPGRNPNRPKIAATATVTNFDVSLGPSAPTDWKLQPQPKPSPDWKKLEANFPDDNWLPVIMDGEILPIMRRMTQLNPRGGFPIAGLCDMWSSFGSERIDSTHLTLLTDLIASMSDTILRTGGMLDAHAIGNATEAWAGENPGIPLRLSNSLEQAQMGGMWNSTLTLDIEFKQRLPKEGIEWAFSRVLTRELKSGRMDVEVTICDQSMSPICVARHMVIVLGAARMFDNHKQNRKDGGSVL